MNERINWKALARARGLDIPEADLELLSARLDGLEEIFRPLVRALTFEQEPAAVFRADVKGE